MTAAARAVGALRLVAPTGVGSQSATAEADAPAVPAAAGWRAALELGFERRAGTTVLARCRHQGPLRVQKALHPEGPATAHVIVLHPPGGIAGGDSLALSFGAAAGAQVLLTTPGAGKWYRAAGRPAAQTVTIEVAAGACIEWLPQETIFFSGADASLRTVVDLAADARYLGLEVLCFGRTAASETFDRGALAMRTRIRRDDRLLWHENARLAGGSAWFAAAPGLAGFPVCATLLLAVPEGPTGITAELITACRESAITDVPCSGITKLPGLLVARCLCAKAEQAKAWFLGLWTHLRPALLGRTAMTPRIWNT